MYLSIRQISDLNKPLFTVNLKDQLDGGIHERLNWNISLFMHVNTEDQQVLILKKMATLIDREKVNIKCEKGHENMSYMTVFPAKYKGTVKCDVCF